MKTETYKITFIELFVIANFDAVTLQKFNISLKKNISQHLKYHEFCFILLKDFWCFP